MSEITKSCGHGAARIPFALCVPVGLVIYMAVRFWGKEMPDFWSGFCLGTSAMFMIIGVAYFGWCLGKSRRPYDFRS